MTWYAIKMGPGKYGIFDTFADENGRNAHLNGEIAKALFAKAKDCSLVHPRLISLRFSHRRADARFKSSPPEFVTYRNRMTDYGPGRMRPGLRVSV